MASRSRHPARLLFAALALLAGVMLPFEVLACQYVGQGSAAGFDCGARSQTNGRMPCGTRSGRLCKNQLAASASQAVAIQASHLAPNLDHSHLPLPPAFASVPCTRAVAYILGPPANGPPHWHAGTHTYLQTARLRL
jgi:hypothetical protein